MEIDEEMRRKIVVSFAALVLLVLAFLAIGVTYGGAGLSATGGYALIGAMVAFILVMAAAGLFLDRRG